MVTDHLPVRLDRSVASQPTTNADREAAISRSERVLISASFTLTVLLHLVYAFRYRFDSDEPQHLHVVWGWTRGLLQYRDVFDNHTPLFHLLFAPLLAALGERADVLIPMRLAMIPLCVLALLATYKIGRELFNRRVGLWAAVFTGLFPAFLIYSIEFRTDVLWTTLWLLALAVFFQSRLTISRAFLGGVLLGAALSVSMKTILLLASLGAALLVTRVLAPKVRGGYRDPGAARLAAAAITGFVLVPLAVVAFFMVEGAGTALLYGAVEHNLVLGLGTKHTNPGRDLLFPLMLPLLGWAGWAFPRRASDPGVGTRRAVVFLTAGLYLFAVHNIWPIFASQDRLPLYPLLIIFLAPLVLAVPGVRFARWKTMRSDRPWMDALIPAGIVVAEMLLLTTVTVWQDGTRDEIGLLMDVLTLTRTDDPILDEKGETIFRTRPFYYALEGITLERIRRGLIIDDIPERLIATRTCVAVAAVGRFPDRARAFLEKNYLPVGRLRVAGRYLAVHNDGTGPLAFDIEIPARYVLLADRGAVTGRLDGLPYEGARFLERGHHEFRPTAQPGRLAVVWAQAVERGYVPFPGQREPL